MEDKLFDLLGLGVPFYLGAATYAVFAWLDSNASDEAKQVVSALIRTPIRVNDAVRSERERLWLSLLIGTFVWVYGEETLSTKRIKRSWAVSTTVIGVITVVWAVLRPEQFAALLYKSKDDTTGIYTGIIFTGYIINLVPDYISSLQTQRTLEFVHTRQKYLSVIPATVALDLVFKTVIFLISYIIFVYSFAHLYHYFSQIRNIWEITSFPTDIRGAFSSLFYNAAGLSSQITGDPPIGIFYYTVLFPSLWLWGLSVLLLITRFAQLVFIIFRAAHWAQWVLKQGDAHPLKAIGIVATIIVFGSAMLVKEGWTLLGFLERS